MARPPPSYIGVSQNEWVGGRGQYERSTHTVSFIELRCDIIYTSPTFTVQLTD